MSGSLLKFVPSNSYNEPTFYVGFGGYIRGNFPKLPSGYTQVYGIQMSNAVPLGVTPRSSDTDIYIYLGFKCLSVTAQWSAVISTQYTDEQSSIVRIITSGYSTTSFYTSMFCKAASGSSFSTGENIANVLMRKDDDSRFYYSSPTSSKSSYNAFLQETPTEMSLNRDNSITLNLYGLFIRQNGTVYHNWIPCKRNSDNKPGFYNAVNGEFITDESMVVVNS